MGGVPEVLPDDLIRLAEPNVTGKLVRVKPPINYPGQLKYPNWKALVL